MIAQHVHHTDLRDGHLEEIGALRHTGSHEQTTIRATNDRQSLLAGITLTDQILGRTDKVVEHVLLLQLRTCLMPFFTIFISATQVHLSIDTALLEERDTER